MSDQSSTHERRRIQRQAVFWEWRLRDPSMTETEFHRFRQWHAIAAHREMLEAVNRVRAARSQAPAPAPASSGISWGWKLVPAALALLVVALLVRDALMSPRILETTSMAQAWRLKDGTIVRAAENTRVEVQIGSHHRNVYLPSGRAFFRVSHDPARPFVVRTGAAIVTALGTSFAVTNDGVESVVTVMDGSVDVAATSSVAPSAGRSRLQLHAGEQARLSSLANSYVRSRVNVEESLEWATLITFVDAAAVEALEQYSELTGTRVNFEHPRKARSGVVSGTFPLDDPDTFAKYVASKTSAPVLVHGPGPVVKRIIPYRALPPE